MSELYTVTINEETFLNLIRKRLEFWTDEKSFIDIYMKMYKQDVNDGMFNNVNININEMVDNDWVNEYSIYEPSNSEYNELYENYDAVRVYSNKMILVRNRLK